MSKRGACNGTFLRLEVEAMSARLWKNVEIKQEDVHNALCFVNNADALKEYLDEDFLQTAEQSKLRFEKSNNYQRFADFCKAEFLAQKTIGCQSILIAICIFFKEVTSAYSPYYFRIYCTPPSPPDTRTEEEKKKWIEDYMQNLRMRKMKQQKKTN